MCLCKYCYLWMDFILLQNHQRQCDISIRIVLFQPNWTKNETRTKKTRVVCNNRLINNEDVSHFVSFILQIRVFFYLFYTYVQNNPPNHNN
jgi:hypothetical protein